VKNRTCLGICLGLNITWFSLLAFWPALLSVAGMGFDAPDTNEHLGNWLFFWFVACYPVGVLAGISCWIAYHKRKFNLAYWLINIPALWPGTFIIMLIIFAILELIGI
jgi:hypothetical protein